MFSHASGQLLPKHTWNPRCAQNFSWPHVQQDIRATAARAHANPRHLDLHPHTKHRGMFMRQHCCARTPLAHLDLSPCAKRHVPAKRLLRSHAGSTVGSLSGRKQTCSCDNTAAFARCELSWLSLLAQPRDISRRKNSVLTPGAQLDLSPCAKNLFMRQHCCVRTL